MAREFRISAVVKLPDDEMDEADVIVAIRPVYTALKEGLGKVAAPEGAEVTYAIVTPKPRNAKGEEG
jgi:hypothetical protein